MNGRGAIPFLVASACASLIGSRDTMASIEIDLASPPPDTFKIQADNIADQFGSRTASCDINGDGIIDLIVGAGEGDGIADSKPQAGEITIYFGARRRWQGGGASVALRSLTIVGQDNFDALGTAVVCGDVDGDGIADIIAGAGEADGPNNLRVNAGQLHIIKGRVEWPAVIDLADTPGTIIYGAAGADHIGNLQLGIGDLNGDGISDIVATTDVATTRSGAGANGGRAHVIFGRTTWPATLDLSYQSDVTIYGAEANDRLGRSVKTGDFDIDGTADLMVSAIFADGLANGRSLCGELYVWRGRATWPSVIDLAVSSPETMIEGADAGDWLGDFYAPTVGDLDGDGRREIIAPLSRADGPTNNKVDAGEMRSYETTPHSTLPSFIDFKSQATLTVFGPDSGDDFCIHEYVGDVNGDGTDDLLCSAYYGDGPGNSRVDSGEIRVLFGRTAFPSSVDLSVTASDISIWGSRTMTRSTIIGLSDINGDGLKEIVALDDSPGNWINPTIWLISPVDQDGDGINALADNCPLVANSDQLDLDSDGRGDACALDWDGDGQSDTLDCAPANKNAGTPLEVAGLNFAASSKTTLQWNVTTFATSFDVSRGTLPRSGPDDFGACQNSRDPDLTDRQFIDGDVPATGSGYFYLVRGRNATCPAVGSWGQTSAGTERVNSNAARCP